MFTQCGGVHLGFMSARMVAPWIINRRSFEVMYGGEFHVIFLVRNGVESVRTVLDFRGTGSVAVIGEKCGDVMFFSLRFISLI